MIRGCLFLRVYPWAVRTLAAEMAATYLNPRIPSELKHSGIFEGSLKFKVALFVFVLYAPILGWFDGKG
jgi:hypothetical protein